MGKADRAQNTKLMKAVPFLKAYPANPTSSAKKIADMFGLSPEAQEL